MEKHLACEYRALEEQGRIRFKVGKTPYMVALVDEEVYCIEDRCPHMKASLTQGTMKGTAVTCKAHGATFDVRTGEVLNKAKLLFLKMPTAKAKTFKTAVEDGKVYIWV